MLTDAFLDQVRGVLPSARQLSIRRLRDLIRLSITDAIAQNRLTSRLPSETELMVEYDASRDSVRDALASLADEGLIERRRGLGTAPIGDRYEFSVYLPPAGQKLEKHLHAGHLSPKLLFWGWLKAPSSIVDKLDGVETGEDCLCVDYVLLRDGRPVGVITNYLRAAEGSRLSPTDFRDDFYTLLDNGDSNVGSHDVVVQAAAVDDHVAALLHIMPGEPVMWFEQSIRNVAGERIDVAVASFRSEVRMGIGNVPRMDLTALIPTAGGSK